MIRFSVLVSAMNGTSKSNLIAWSVQYLSRQFLHMLMLVAFITEGGRLFQVAVTLSEKACFRIFFWALWANNLGICPLFPILVTLSLYMTNLGETSLSYIVCRILYTSVMSPLSLL